MAYDEGLAERMRKMLGDQPGLTEKQMFGGLAFMIGGNMACGVSGKGGMIVRLAAGDTEDALQHAGVRIFDMTGRPMKGWLIVEEQVIAEDEDLRHWVDVGVAYASSLPPKQK
jgi:hypothetical protein